MKIGMNKMTKNVISREGLPCLPIFEPYGHLARAIFTCVFIILDHEPLIYVLSISKDLKALYVVFN